MSKTFSHKPDFLPEAESHIRSFFKHYANKKVRKNLNVDNGSQYKKLYNPSQTKELNNKLSVNKMLKGPFIRHDITEDLLKSG